ncbi:TPA: hypothetical protein H1012_02890 [archaeon]|nr:hypothetical protein [Candidatus Naiadarchaeales archaeon SRR2090159.bin1288]
MKRNFPNNKGQFFIAMAVVVIFALSAIFFYILNANYATDASIQENDIGFFANNIKDEFDKVAELTLANVSAYKGTSPALVNPTNAFDSNLSSFSRFAQAIAAQNGMLLNVSYFIGHATNTSMNATVNLTFRASSSIISTSFSAFSNISVNALNGSLTNQLPTGCTFNFTARREYGERIINLSAPNFIFTINNSAGVDTACSSPTYVEGEPGKYNITCASSNCAGSRVVVNVTDTRNIVSWSVIPNTGSTSIADGNVPNKGCAATCGQPLD